MPQRRLAGLALTLLAPAAVAGCAIKVHPSSVPAPFSQAPIPYASTAQPAYLCTTVYQILTSGAAELTGDIGGPDAAARKNMQTTLADMAAKVAAQAPKTTDTRLNVAINEIATSLRTASRQPDPSSYLNGSFTTVGQKLDGVCP